MSEDPVVYGTRRLEALRPQWAALCAKKADAWDELEAILLLLEEAWQHLQAVHTQQQELCQDLPPLRPETVQEWTMRRQVSLWYGPARHPTLPHPMASDLGVSGVLRGTKGAQGTLAPRKESLHG